MSNIFVFNHKTGFFDIKTKTNLGIFSQVFLEDKSSLRSDHSIHSISAIENLRIYSKRSCDFSFGINSPFEDF